MKEMSLIPDAQTEYIDSMGATAVIWALPKKGKGTMKVRFQYCDGKEHGQFFSVTASQFRGMFKLKVKVVK